ncbi:endonuclease III domain-containing protein [Candidatus Woesearchaeota archaeon]|nr:endonuclease III domain-containing protein [Candidatus Woesearchaeota archaeon]
MQDQLFFLYKRLLETYGYQGWWPLLCERGKGCNAQGYHPQCYTYPHTDQQCIEIIGGAILTQNTAWKNAEKALLQLYQQKLLTLRTLDKVTGEELAQYIRPSGYYNQKAKKLKNVVHFLTSTPLKQLMAMDTLTARKHLLEIQGIGPETADCILLYALHKPIFVVDAYTHTLLTALGLVSGRASYESIQRMFMDTLPADEALFNEYHALLVAWGKALHNKQPTARAIMQELSNRFK